MEKIYGVFHIYDVDGGYGDAIQQVEMVGITASLKEAEEFVLRYNNPHVYFKPYDKLYCHKLVIREVCPLNIDKNPFKHGLKKAPHCSTKTQCEKED